MTYTLTNDLLTARFKSEGAELIQLIDSQGLDYVWNADERYWKRYTPILFPIVGKVMGNSYEVDDKKFILGQHGFARDQEFVMTTQTASSIVFTLEANALTRTLYPFNFILQVIYTLTGNSLAITYKVTNTDTQTIAFKIGAHPAFMCPLFENELMEDYFLEFENDEDTQMMLLNKEGFFTHETLPFEGKRIPLSVATFKNDALVFCNLKSQAITLRSYKNTHSLRVDFEGFTHLGIWSLVTGAPFVCIEPWIGHADFEDDSPQLFSKKDITLLNPLAIFECTHTLSVQ